VRGTVRSGGILAVWRVVSIGAGRGRCDDAICCGGSFDRAHVTRSTDDLISLLSALRSALVGALVKSLSFLPHMATPPATGRTIRLIHTIGWLVCAAVAATLNGRSKEDHIGMNVESVKKRQASNDSIWSNTIKFFFTFVTYSYVWRTPLDSLYGAQYHVVSIQLQSTRSRQIIGAVIREVRGNGKLTHHQPASPNCIHPLPVCLKICFDARTSADTLMGELCRCYNVLLFAILQKFCGKGNHSRHIIVVFVSITAVLPSSLLPRSSLPISQLYSSKNIR